jgi:ribonuclease Y
VRAVRDACERAVEQCAGLTRAEVAEKLAETLVEEARSQCADRLRNLEATGAEEFARQAKRVMGIVMQRYTGHCVRERAAMTMALPEGGAVKLRGAAAREMDRLGEATHVRLIIADDDSSVRLDSGDGVAREVCRRALTRLIEQTPVPDAEQLATTLKAELDRELRRLGREAFRALRLKDGSDEALDLMGRLNFRTSYTQNQYRHAIEAGHLAGMIAAELGMDPAVARRGALMHDIAKALSHEVDGSHALIGAEVARRGGESEAVANAIAHHHGEEPATSAYAPLVAGVDAMSGGRPGARREMVESYGDRIGDLEKIAGRFPGVTRVHAMQAGREVRVHVDEGRVGEDELQQISTAIAAKISEEMTFPGQIRVTVIREFCAVEYAS